MIPHSTPSSPAHLPMCPLTARGLISDERGRWLIVRPLGGNRWTLPGGLVERNEPPPAACVREIREEIALETRAVALLVVGWTESRRADRPPRVSFVFDMGEYDSAHLERTIRLQDNEIADWQLAAPRQALPVLNHELALRLNAHRSTDSTAVYFEHHPSRQLHTN